MYRSSSSIKGLTNAMLYSFLCCLVLRLFSILSSKRTFSPRKGERTRDLYCSKKSFPSKNSPHGEALFRFNTLLNKLTIIMSHLNGTNHQLYFWRLKAKPLQQIYTSWDSLKFYTLTLYHSGTKNTFFFSHH